MTMRQEIKLSHAYTPLSHYTNAVRFGEMLFISGVTALGADNTIVGEGDVVAQAEFIFATIERILEQAGGSFADVLRVTVYLLDVDDRTKINPVRQKYFGETRPASTLIGVKALAVPGMLIEIEAVAGLPSAA